MQKLEFDIQTGENQKVYGAIGEKDIIRAIKRKYKISLSKKHISMPDGHIKKLGETVIFVKLGKDAMAKVFICVNKKA